MSIIHSPTNQKLYSTRGGFHGDFDDSAQADERRDFCPPNPAYNQNTVGDVPIFIVPPIGLCVLEYPMEMIEEKKYNHAKKFKLLLHDTLESGQRVYFLIEHTKPLPLQCKLLRAKTVRCTQRGKQISLPSTT